MGNVNYSDAFENVGGKLCLFSAGCQTNCQNPNITSTQLNSSLTAVGFTPPPTHPDRNSTAHVEMKQGSVN